VRVVRRLGLWLRELERRQTDDGGGKGSIDQHA